MTASDRCSRGEAKDESGEELKKLAEGRGWTVSGYVIVPDEESEIENRLKEWCGKTDVILTTGGTGLSPRDVTPEATRKIIEKEFPGVSELMRLEGLKHTPNAALSRALAGSAGSTLIINFPGSPRAVRQSFEAVAGIIPHALEMMAGGGH